ncbi:hypothetical protein [Thiococcus pfennigii]|jgi:hypothetical protein|uniref:hypothetical protein n=1 Tax=Thiococcus pfennigii TaxID=1057 RepID=UPI00190364FF|nr:hypothetical protein [Thiococcus pfennigii]MBK1701149.1 hypothetical protein [Thiococcus pfennigii]MBK1732857.1 hypothetical protein [Thiococcus pfennigii]
MLTTITTIAGFGVGSLLLLIAIFFAIKSRTFGKDIISLVVIALVMIGLSTWQVVKPNLQAEAGYVPWDDTATSSD